MELRPTRLDELPAVRSFLGECFKAPDASSFLNPALVEWKYYEPGPGWEGSRSYVLEQNGEFAAHACLWPITILTAGGPIASFMLPDWCASPKFPGSGLMIMLALEKLVGTRIGIGGSASARKRLSTVRTVASLETEWPPLLLYRWIARPASFARQPGLSGSVRLQALKTVLAQRTLRPAASAGWKAEEVTQFDGELLGHTLLPPSPSWALCKRTPEFLNFLLRCPTVPFRGYRLIRHREVVGHFVLSFPGQEARIADLSVNSAQVDDWSASYALATRTALLSPDVNSVTVCAYAELVQTALAQAGFQPAGNRLVRIGGDRARLANLPRPHFNFCDYDAAFFTP